MNIISDDAIIVRRRIFGEDDFLITLLSSERGKITAIAPGARKLNHRFDTHFEPGTVVFANLYRRRPDHMPRIEECESLMAPLARYRQLEHICLLSLALEVCERLAAEQAGEEPLYHLLLGYLHHLQVPHPKRFLLQGLVAQAMKVAGFGLQLRACVRCGGRLAASGKVLINSSSGGAICQRCANVDAGLIETQKSTHAEMTPNTVADHKPNRESRSGPGPGPGPDPGLGIVRITHGTLQLLQHLFNDSFSRLLKIRTMRAQETEIQAILFTSLRHILGFELKSERVMRQLEKIKKP